MNTQSFSDRLGAPRESGCTSSEGDTDEELGTFATNVGTDESGDLVNFMNYLRQSPTSRVCKNEEEDPRDRVGSTWREHRTARLSDAVAVVNAENDSQRDPVSPTEVRYSTCFASVSDPRKAADINNARMLEASVRADGGECSSIQETSFRAGFQSRFCTTSVCCVDLDLFVRTVMRPLEARRVADVRGATRPLSTGHPAVDTFSTLFGDASDPFSKPARPGNIDPRAHDVPGMEAVIRTVDTLQSQGGWSEWARRVSRDGAQPLTTATPVGSEGLIEIIFGSGVWRYFDHEQTRPDELSVSTRGVTRQAIALLENMLAWVPTLHKVFVDPHKLGGKSSQEITERLAEVAMFPPLPPHTHFGPNGSSGKNADVTPLPVDGWAFQEPTENPLELIMRLLQHPDAMKNSKGSRLYTQTVLHVTAPVTGMRVTTRHLQDTEPTVCRLQPLPHEPCQPLFFLAPLRTVHVVVYVGLVSQAFVPGASLGAIQVGDPAQVCTPPAVPNKRDRTGVTKRISSRPRVEIEIEGDAAENLNGGVVDLMAHGTKPTHVARTVLEFAEDRCPESRVFTWHNNRRSNVTKNSVRASPGDMVRVVPVCHPDDLMPEDGGAEDDGDCETEAVFVRPYLCTVDCGLVCMNVLADKFSRFNVEAVSTAVPTMNLKVISQSPLYTPRALLAAAMKEVEAVLRAVGKGTTLGDFALQTPVAEPASDNPVG
jgi:hypothetical protein